MAMDTLVNKSLGNSMPVPAKIKQTDTLPVNNIYLEKKNIKEESYID